MLNKEATVRHVIKCCDVGTARNGSREEVVSTEDLKVKWEVEMRRKGLQPEEPANSKTQRQYTT